MQQNGPQHDPTFYSWIYLFLLSAWGGVINHLQRANNENIIVRLLVVDIGTPVLAGLISAYIGLAIGMGDWWIYALVALSTKHCECQCCLGGFHASINTS
ncbi:hypothetical protein CCP3SC15_550001 [Gammaproteobacteria bacterium]